MRLIQTFIINCKGRGTPMAENENSSVSEKLSSRNKNFPEIPLFLQFSSRNFRGNRDF